MMIIMAATAQEVQNDSPKPDVKRHELSVYGLGGYSPLLYTLDGNGSKSGSTGGGAGLGYTFNISPSLGITTGVEMMSYSSKASFDNIDGNYSEGTGTTLFRFTYSLANYSETQNITLLSIPVMAQYSVPLGGSSVKYYASGGLKFGFPVSAKADIASCKTTAQGLKGYFAYEDIEYTNLPQHGFGSNTELPKVSKDLDLGFSLALALETGARFTLTDKIALYTGLYFDYGLNNIQKTSDKHIIEYNASDVSNASNTFSFGRHSVLDTAAVDKINLLSVGLKVRISFNL
jgi:hypothetical protein